MPPVNTTPVLPWGRDVSEEGSRQAQLPHGTSSGTSQVKRAGSPEQAASPSEPGGSRSPKRARTDEGAINPAEDAAQVVDPPSEEACLSLESVGLKEGDRVEVKWEVAHDDGKVEKRWWGAKVLGEAKRSQGDTKNVYDLLYDAWSDFGEEVAQVSFLADRELFDNGCMVHSKSYLRWRKEGEDVDSEDDGDDEVDESAFTHEEVTMQELNQVLTDDPENEELERRAMDELSALPADRQHHIAAGFRDMVDRVRDGLAAIASGGGESRAITKQDIEAIFQGMRPR